MPTLAINKRAKFDYALEESKEAGLVLSGQEVKSAKTGHISLKGSFVTIKGQELFLTNALIPRYKHAKKGTYTEETTQPRKLLLKKREIKHLVGKARTESLTLVPIRVYTSRGLIKLEFAVGKGKKEFDKRHTIGKRDAQRKIDRALKSR
ncbi:MAG: SsrA-binding protein SmpB [Candidatus Moranbacteria bacterium]|nr:SsrA-binding protein SmpB [Candidatus Moranbacteria bacterium]